MLLLSTGEQDLAPLTTPIAYAVGKLPADPFADHRDQVFAFINLRDLREAYPSQPVGGSGGVGAGRRFVLMSFGPDTDEAVPNLANPVRGPFTAYDPTNGTVSPGDLFAFGGANPAGDTGPPPPPPPKSTAPRDPTPSVTAEPANI